MRILLSVLLFLWLVSILSLTLWPFDFSQSNLAAFVPGRGLQFASPSMAIGEGQPAKITGLDSLAVLLHFFPDAASDDPGCILDYTPLPGPANLRIAQEGRSLYFFCRDSNSRLKELRVQLTSLDSLQTVIFTASGKLVSAVGAEGVVAATETRISVADTWDRNAVLIFGCTASGFWRWGGTLVKFEVFGTDRTKPASHGSDELLAYDFTRHDERGVMDLGREPRVPLFVPPEVKPPTRRILSSPFARWDGFWNKTDIILNVIAFAPFGFLLGLFFPDRLRKWPLILAVTGIGCAISLSVEIAQFFLPWRDSSIVDVFTNTLGGFCGVWLCTKLRPWLTPIQGYRLSRSFRKESI